MSIPLPAWLHRMDLLRYVRAVKAWRQRRRMGLPPLRTPPVTFIPEVDPTAFMRSGYRPLPVTPRTYERQAMDYRIEDQLLDLDDPDLEVDGSGVAIWRDEKGNHQHHPVYVAQYALAALGGYSRTDDERYLQRALVNAEALVDHAEADNTGRLWFPYHHPHRYYDVSVPPPWHSSMGQGQPLSVFCRLAELFPADARWRELADATFATFDAWRALGRPWVTTMDAHGCLWFEEYAADVEPLLVVNGHIFGLYGIYDYAMLTGDEHAIDLFDGGATTIRNHIDTIRVPGGVSYYCAREGYCQRPEWQHAGYQAIHVQQLWFLGQMTADTAFTEASRLFAADVA